MLAQLEDVVLSAEATFTTDTCNARTPVHKTGITMNTCKPTGNNKTTFNVKAQKVQSINEIKSKISTKKDLTKKSDFVVDAGEKSNM